MDKVNTDRALNSCNEIPLNSSKKGFSFSRLIGFCDLTASVKAFRQNDFRQGGFLLVKGLAPVVSLAALVTVVYSISTVAYSVYDSNPHGFIVDKCSVVTDKYAQRDCLSIGINFEEKCPVLSLESSCINGRLNLDEVFTDGLKTLYSNNACNSITEKLGLQEQCFSQVKLESDRCLRNFDSKCLFPNQLASYPYLIGKFFSN